MKRVTLDISLRMDVRGIFIFSHTFDGKNNVIMEYVEYGRWWIKSKLHVYFM